MFPRSRNPYSDVSLPNKSGIWAIIANNPPTAKIGHVIQIIRKTKIEDSRIHTMYADATMVPMTE